MEWNSSAIFELTHSFPMHPFSTPTPQRKKTSENHKVFWCVHGVEKGFIGNEWVKTFKIHLTLCKWCVYSHNPKWIKLIKCLRLCLSHLCEPKFQHSLQDSHNPFVEWVKLDQSLITYSNLVSLFVNKRMILLNFIRKIYLNISE